MRYSDIRIRPELTWEAHLASAPDWLAPHLEVPADASAPLVMTPVHEASTGSYGADAIEWIERELKVRLRWWQRLATVRQLEHDADGRLVFSSIAESASRRAGKSLRLRSMALWRLDHRDLFGEPQLAVHCGKDLAIVREIQRGAWRWAEQRDWRVVRAIGRESIEHDDDRWLARSTDAVYGYDVNLGYVDESWAVDPETVTEGLEPATLERVSAQIVLTSTAHRRATSLMPGRIRDAMKVDDGTTLLLLWSAPDEAEMGAEETWKAASPHWSEDRARLMAAKWRKAQAGEQDEEFDDVNPVAGFLSQYVNRWQLASSKVGGALPHGVWLELKDPTAPRGTKPVFGLDISADRTAWIAVAWKRPDGAVQVMLTNDGKPYRADDLADEALRLQVQWGGVLVPHRDVEEALERKGALMVKAGSLDFTKACGKVADMVASGTIRHGNHAALNAAVKLAQWRSAGALGEKAFKLSDFPEVAPLAAVVRAIHGVCADVDYDILDSIF